MQKFKAVDYYNLDEELTSEEQMSRDTTRRFVDEKIVPIIADHFERAAFPCHLIPEMGTLGFFGANLEGYGCAGLSNTAAGIIMRELERGDSGIRSFTSVQSSLVMYPLHTFGDKTQKEKWLPLLASGEKIGCFGLTEPNHGSDPKRMETKAQPVSDGFILNGAKLWITNGSLADVVVVWAQSDGDIHGFLVEKGTPGFTNRDLHGKLSMRASVTSELVFENCFVPEENRLPFAEGLKAPLMCLNQARYGIAWGAAGAAMACYDIALQYAQERKQYGKPIASFQLIQKTLADMLANITKAQALCLRLGRLKDAGKLNYAQVSLAKRENAEMAFQAAVAAQEILGAMGIMGEYHIMRHMMNMATVKTYEGTPNIHTLILGRDITGISAFE